MIAGRPSAGKPCTAGAAHRAQGRADHRLVSAGGSAAGRRHHQARDPVTAGDRRRRHPINWRQCWPTSWTSRSGWPNRCSSSIRPCGSSGGCCGYWMPRTICGWGSRGAGCSQQPARSCWDWLPFHSRPIGEAAPKRVRRKRLSRRRRNRRLPPARTQPAPRPETKARFLREKDALDRIDEVMPAWSEAQSGVELGIARIHPNEGNDTV